MRKAIKIIGSIVVILLLLLFGAQWWLGNKLKDVIQHTVYEQTNGAVRAEVGGVSVRLIGRTVRVKNIRLSTDTTHISSAGQPWQYMNTDIEEIALKGVHFQHQDSVVKIRLREFRLDIPSMQARVSLPDTLKYPADLTVRGRGNRFSTHLEVEKLNIRLGKVQYEQYKGLDSVSYALRDFRFRMEDWIIDDLPDAKKPLCSCTDMQMSLASFRTIFAERSQLLEADTCYLGEKEGRLSIASVRLIPLYSKQDFAYKTKKHTDWTRIEVGKIDCYRLDMQKMMADQVVKVDSVMIRGADISTYKNRQVEQAKRKKRLFYESVQELPFPLEVRRIGLENINVEYQELAENGTEPGTITFNRLEGMFYDLTNIVQPHRPYFVLEAQGKLMNQGNLQATFHLPVDSLNQHFQVEGNLGEMNMVSLNSMLEPLVKVKIDSGEIREMKFQITGNSKQAEVNMEFLYNGLKVSVLKEKDGKMKDKPVLSYVVNNWIIQEDNPGSKGIRKAHASADRDIYRSQFNYLWRTLLAGLKISLGI